MRPDSNVFQTAAAYWQRATDSLAADAVAPALAWLHIPPGHLDAHEIASAGMISVLQLAIIALVFRPLESIAPAERWDGRKHTSIDRSYTLLMLLGLFPLFSYLVLSPFARLLGMDGAGTSAPEGGLADWVPWFRDHPVALFGAYYVVYDLAYYCMHRMQHALPWWWALHSMHHSQRQMSCWSNDRTSYIDGVLQSLVLALVGIALGVDPSQFALLVLLSELMQNFSHANVRIGFGPFQRLLVDPRFHRLHHMRLDPERPNLHNCNFGQVLSIWDVIFRTSLYGEPPRPTGVSDPVVDADNERGIVGQQWYTARRFWRSLWCRAGWRLGDVAFGDDFTPAAVARHGETSAGRR